MSRNFSKHNMHMKIMIRMLCDFKTVYLSQASIYELMLKNL